MSRQQRRALARAAAWRDVTVEHTDPRDDHDPRHMRRAHSGVRKRRWFRRERMLVLRWLVGTRTYGASLAGGSRP